MPQQLEKSFQRSGITHVLAISGQHVVILAGVIYFAIRILAIPPDTRAGVTVHDLALHPHRRCSSISHQGWGGGNLRARRAAPRTPGLPLALHEYDACPCAGIQSTTHLQHRLPALRGRRTGDTSALTRPLKSLLERILLRPLKSPPAQVSNLISVSLAAQLATSPIVAATFEQVSVVGVFTNLIAVPLSGPILILGLFGSVAGNIHPLLAYPLNACNGFLVTILIQTAQGASSLPVASVTTPGVTLLLVGLFYAGCLPPIVAGRIFSSERKSLWASLLLVWSVLWLVLVAAGRI